MRKFLSILLLVVFTMSQYGKIASYVYCKIEAEVKAQSCDCEKQLVQKTQDHSGHDHPIQVKQLSEESYITAQFYFNTSHSFLNKTFNTAVSSSVMEGFECLPLRPPAMI